MDARTSVLDGRSVRRRRSSLRLLITRLASSEIESSTQSAIRQRTSFSSSSHGKPHSRAAHKRRCLPKQQVQTRHEAPHLAARPSATSERPPHACNATTSSAPSAACHSRSEATAPPSRLEGSAAASLVTGGAALAAGGAASNDAASATRKHVLVRPAARARWEAYATASALASMPSTRNCGIAAASSSVKSPLPQPRSMTSGSASEEGTAAVCLPSSSARAWCSIHRSCGSFFSR
mmetsp:Transcript_11014/g.35015  ORF Transcript_11014/g.35015 Transcript_11014/m.35015 type:complete len:236 (-) Transcript_11014:966-1673(-)